MSEKKERPKNYYTPRVVFEFPRLNEADPKYNALNPQFSVKFLADPSNPVIAELVALLDAAVAAREAESRKEISENKKLSPPKRAEKLAEMKAMPGYEEAYDDNDQPTGMLRFKASTGSVFKDKTGKTITRKVPLFDARKVDITRKAPKIGGGSEGRLNVTVGSGILNGNPWAKLYLSGVQLLKLVEFGSSNAAAGFDSEDDGYDGDGYEAEDFGAGDAKDTQAAGAGGEADEEL